jgi:hypothetical protein
LTGIIAVPSPILGVLILGIAILWALWYPVDWLRQRKRERSRIDTPEHIIGPPLRTLNAAQRPPDYGLLLEQIRNRSLPPDANLERQIELALQKVAQESWVDGATTVVSAIDAINQTSHRRNADEQQ